eukprot:TRINITY_DN54652_c0_g1_i1.p1 TRINITY_DN54652_c0_g1~~TRINITY_DN54652_c0_g1_i1.p1  ORF type:complete len:587 (-),score=106.54 TRINITY_DN54652_c0_g1_i1:79-1773(-)
MLPEGKASYSRSLCRATALTSGSEPVASKPDALGTTLPAGEPSYSRLLRGDGPDAVAAPLNLEGAHNVGKVQTSLQRVALVACLLVMGALAYANVKAPDQQQHMHVVDQNALSLAEEVTDLGKGHKGCRDASASLHKILDVVRVLNQTGHASHDEEVAAKDILHGEQSEKVLHEVEEVMRHTTLNEALALGEAITADDMNQLVQCELGETIPVHLEESNDTIEGDMMMPEGEGGRQLKERVLTGRKWAGNLWKDGEIKYCYAHGVNTAAKEAFQAGMKHIMDQVPCVHFKEIDVKDTDRCSELPSLMLRSPEKKSCKSYVGCIGWAHKSQAVNLGKGCESLGTAAHELAHAMGMTHEHSRADRRQSIVIHYGHIKEGKEGNFRLRGDAFKGNPYDVLSLMHYSSHAFSKDGHRTVETTNQALANLIGQRLGFSELDVEQVGEMYGCKANITPLTKNKEVSLGHAAAMKVAHAPFTKAGCLCKRDWNPCAKSQNGYCCTPQGANEHSGGDWCKTEGECEGQNWDHCTAREVINEDPLPLQWIKQVGSFFQHSTKPVSDWTSHTFR